MFFMVTPCINNIKRLVQLMHYSLLKQIRIKLKRLLQHVSVHMETIIRERVSTLLKLRALFMWLQNGRIGVDSVWLHNLTCEDVCAVPCVSVYTLTQGTAHTSSQVRLCSQTLSTPIRPFCNHMNNARNFSKVLTRSLMMVSI